MEQKASTSIESSAPDSASLTSSPTPQPPSTQQTAPCVDQACAWCRRRELERVLKSYGVQRARDLWLSEVRRDRDCKGILLFDLGDEGDLLGRSREQGGVKARLLYYPRKDLEANPVYQSITRTVETKSEFLVGLRKRHATGELCQVVALVRRLTQFLWVDVIMVDHCCNCLQSLPSARSLLQEERREPALTAGPTQETAAIPLLEASIELAKSREECRKCHLAAYCGTACRKEHAARHKKVCEEACARGRLRAGPRLGGTAKA